MDSLLRGAGGIKGKIYLQLNYNYLLMDIVIIEDEIEIAHLIEQTLERESFTCHLAYNGRVGLELFYQKQPDLVILDLMLPELDGLELCARIRQKPGNKDPYILMLTARGEEIDRIIGLSTGADDYMVKPFSPRDILLFVNWRECQRKPSI